MGFTVSLKNRLALTYALFTGAALGLLALVINLSTGIIFNALVRENIRIRSGEIVRAMNSLYNPMTRSFDARAVEALGMSFVHEGYIVSVEDGRGEPVWNARSCDMEQCVSVIGEITSRMETRFRVNGGMRSLRYEIRYNDRTAGAVIIDSYGPFFYSETETKFLVSVNRILLLAGAALTLLSVAVSIAISGAIARPVNTAGEAARRIAQTRAAGGSGRAETVVRIWDGYRTRELAELSRSINHLASELEEAERRQKRVSADIAHELRTPLTCLQGTIEAMIDGVYEVDMARLESCHEEIIRLTGLVNGLDTLAGLEWETSALKMSRFRLDKLLQTTAEQFRPAADEKGVEIALNLVESPVSADYDRLKQVFVNIMSNAVKYTERGSVTVSVRDLRAGGASGFRWEAAIADTGCGIGADDLPHIFERLYRADKSRGRGTGGAGIGLSIAAAIVRAHGGSITAESPAENSRGSVFRVRLP
ncbi:MAG: HAMP domain-containing histidine kinase [Spirochaetaceae bacterium]|jgi:signal transduction histidine kinase|nr:HAMP domain-containing histidine kinase [Spirochaetaceae bacterium]